MARLPIVVAKNPRYFALLAVVLLTAIFFLFPSDHPYNGASYLRNKLSPSYVKDALRDEELEYNKVLADRENMVLKFGPNASQIQAFPLTGDFYTLWDFFIPAFQCPHRVERVGTMGDGGKWVCGLARIAKQKECVIYSFGLNGESSFEASLLKRAPGCQVWGYDFSVNSFGPEIESVPALKQRSHFHPYALGFTNDHSPGSNPPYYTLASLMEINDHDFIDILKIDIEGAEFDALAAFMNSMASHPLESKHPHGASPGRNGGLGGLPIGQMQIEIHAWEGSPYGQFETFKKWWEKLEGVGLRPFWTEPNLVYINIMRGDRPQLSEYSFMNIRGDHALVSDTFT